MDKQSYYRFPNPEAIPAGMVQPVHIARHLDFNSGAVVKYVSRAGRKTADPLPDLLKALDHLQDEIALVRERQASEKITVGVDVTSGGLVYREDKSGVLHYSHDINPGKKATTVSQLASDDPAGISSVLKSEWPVEGDSRA